MLKHNRVVFPRFLLLVLFVVAFSSFSYAQNTGVISGTVTDPSKAIIPGADVTIVNADTGVTVWHGKTNASGVYRGPAMGAGQYTIAVEANGFKRATVSGVNLAVDQRADISVTMETGVPPAP